MQHFAAEHDGLTDPGIVYTGFVCGPGAAKAARQNDAASKSAIRLERIIERYLQ